MRYPHTRRKSSRRLPGGKTFAGTVAVVLILGGLFSYSVYEFRQPQESAATVVSAPETVPATFASLTIASAASSANQASLHDASGATVGMATRSEEDVYRLKIKTSLPGIDRESQFYEGWLVRPIPYQYFSIGDMVTNDLGEFVLEWEGGEGKKYDDYTQIIITLEAKDGNPDPSGHVLEGKFD